MAPVRRMTDPAEHEPASCRLRSLSQMFPYNDALPDPRVNQRCSRLRPKKGMLLMTMFSMKPKFDLAQFLAEPARAGTRTKAPRFYRPAAPKPDDKLKVPETQK